MGEPPSAKTVAVVAADEQDEVDVDVERWSELARDVLTDEGRQGELTLTFVDRDEMTALNRQHMDKDGPTDVLSFPLDAFDAAAFDMPPVPVLIGDVVVCPGVAAEQAPSHTGALDDELALLVVHGILHVIGHDHADAEEASRMRTRELDHLQRHHWRGPVPDGFRQEHDGDEGSR